MNWSLVWDPLFRLPFGTGLLLALSLPLVGAVLRLREQWLSSLGVAQMAAAGGVAASLLHWPIIPAAALAAVAAGIVRATLGTARNEHYAVMLVAGWAIVLLLAMFGHHASTTAEALLNGQLYFASLPQLLAAAGLLACVLGIGRWLTPRLLLERLFPDHFAANLQPTWPHEILFEATLIAAVVLGILTMGVMATFAMMFIPPWVSFRLARGWPATLLLAATIGVSAFVAGFVVAVAADLPFGPALVAALLAALPLRLLPGRLHFELRSHAKTE